MTVVVVNESFLAFFPFRTNFPFTKRLTVIVTVAGVTTTTQMSEKKKSFLPLFVLHCILKWPLRIHNQKLFLKPDIYNPFKIIGAIEIILRIFASGLEKKGQL